MKKAIAVIAMLLMAGNVYASGGQSPDQKSLKREKAYAKCLQNSVVKAYEQAKKEMPNGPEKEYSAGDPFRVRQVEIQKELQAVCAANR